MVNKYLIDNFTSTLEESLSALNDMSPASFTGTITSITGETIRIAGLSGIASLGDQFSLETNETGNPDGEVISLETDEIIALLYADPTNIRIGMQVCHMPQEQPHPSDMWIGKVLDYAGRDATGSPAQPGLIAAPLKADPPAPALRKPLGDRLNTSLPAFDTFLPLCKGQRLGLFAGSGVGKSTLLSHLARGVDTDVVVLALIGERGREVRSFVEHTLGPEGMKRAIVFVATSNDPAPLKKRAAYLAMATAEYFRDQGKQVLLLFDSLTRFAEAHREAALTAGEVPSLRAFPPSTFRAVAALTERAGPGVEDAGDITAVFSVLVAGSNMEEPVADMVRGILDGHVVLDRDIAERGRYPAIDIRRSVSRSLPMAASEEENALLIKARSALGIYEESAPLIRAGLYAPGADPALDEAVALWPAIDQFVGSLNSANADESFTMLREILMPKPAEQPPENNPTQPE